MQTINADCRSYAVLSPGCGNSHRAFEIADLQGGQDSRRRSFLHTLPYDCERPSENSAAIPVHLRPYSLGNPWHLTWPKLADFARPFRRPLLLPSGYSTSPTRPFLLGECAIQFIFTLGCAKKIPAVHMEPRGSGIHRKFAIIELASSPRDAVARQRNRYQDQAGRLWDIGQWLQILHVAVGNAVVPRAEIVAA